jgi:tetratricopeptide (TPR) repeat protein
MARSAFASTKGYQKLEPFIVRLYTSLHRSQAFGKSDLVYEISFLYMIAHTLYRNRKFDEAEAWLDKIALQLPAKQLKSLDLYSKIIALRAAIACYQGKNSFAVQYMEKALDSRSDQLDWNEKLNMQLNLAVYYFIEEKFKKANNTLLAIGHSNNWLEENMGKEWRFKKNMIELIVQYELGNVEEAFSKLKGMKRYFAKFLGHPSYKNASIFMGFIDEMIQDPEIVKTSAFHKKVEKAGQNWGEMKYDIQAITFFSWLSSKMQQRSYYQLLLDEVNPGCKIQ